MGQFSREQAGQQDLGVMSFVSEKSDGVGGSRARKGRSHEGAVTRVQACADPRGASSYKQHSGLARAHLEAEEPASYSHACQLPATNCWERR